MSLDVVAAVVGGRVEGAEQGHDVVVNGSVVIDSREAGPGSLFVAFAGERVDGHEHASQAAANGAVAVLGTRVTELPTVVVANTQDALQRLAAHVLTEVRRAGGLTVLALTGSQGKTSTKDLLAAVLARSGPTVATLGNFNNEIGVPLTVLRLEPDTRYLVVEMGARHIGNLADLTALVPPDVALVLNVGVAHLGEFGSVAAIAQAKGELVQGLRPGGTAVLNAEDDRVAAMASSASGPVLTFGETGRADVRIDALTFGRWGRPRFTLATASESASVTMRVIGAHQAMNAAAAAAAALSVGLSLAGVASTLSEVATLSKWRMELHELPGGVVLLNDSYNANPDSMRNAIRALRTIGTDPAVRRTVAVLGVMRELGADSDRAHHEIGEYAAEHVDQLLVVGPEAIGIHVGAGARSIHVEDNAAAIAWIRAELGDGDAVLVKASNGARLFEVAAALT